MKPISTSILLVCIAALLSSCAQGPQAGSFEDASRITDPTEVENKTVLLCNQATGTELSMKMKVYRASDTDEIRNDYIVAKLTALPTTFKTGASYISMFKWLADTTGNTYLDNAALSFIVMNPDSGLAVTNWAASLRWSDVSAAATTLGLSDPQAFFNKMIIIVDLKDVNADYDVLRITNYNSATNKSLNQVDGLIPMFHISPNKYATQSDGGARPMVLQKLHPFYSQLESNPSNDKLSSLASGFCF